MLGLLGLSGRRSKRRLRMWEPFNGNAIGSQWTVTDTESKLSVASGLLSCSGGMASPADADPGLVGVPNPPRRAGITAIFQITPTATNTIVRLGLGSAYNDMLGVRLHSDALIYLVTNAALLATPKGYAAASQYIRVVVAATGTGGIVYWSDDAVTWYPIGVATSDTITAMRAIISNNSAAWSVDYVKIYQGRVQAPIISGTAPAVTLTYGSEILTNGNMETGSPPSSWSSLLGGVLTAVADERTGGAGAQSINIQNGIANSGIAEQGVTLVVGGWYQLSAWKKRVTGSGSPRAYVNSAVGLNAPLGGTSWGSEVVTGRATAASNSVNLLLNSATIGHESRHDDVSLVSITLSSALSGGGDAGSKYGVFDAALTIPASGYQAGLLCGLDSAASPANYLHGYVDIMLGKAYLLKVVGGTTTELIAAAVTYGAGKKLRIVASPGSSGLSNAQVALYYGTAGSEAQVGTTQTVDMSSGFGTLVRGFDTAGTSTIVLTVNV